ncbi:MAG: Essential protein Yae1, N terminal [Alectoria fallacina]|uniref:Protein YAE1 n=1 Tax=Alectoria fallacina TaxID=1903189 RepID=A0A8H3EIV1_9LECA|nr:MAG: Essential protein Yae1, N terminal [Alectoria fallacina]
MPLTPPSTPPSPSSPTNNHLSDIFSDSPPNSPTTADPSDIPRLRSTHSTAGYRAGISTSKQRSVQPGFDQGYSLGAVFGLQVGYILGVLEGLWSAHPHEGEKRRTSGQLVKEARKDLAVEKIFGREWWREDGIWRYQVVGMEEEVTFREVVDAHPLVRRWAEMVDREIKIADVKMGRFEGSEWEDGRMGDGKVDAG